MGKSQFFHYRSGLGIMMSEVFAIPEWVYNMHRGVAQAGLVRGTCTPDDVIFDSLIR